MGGLRWHRLLDFRRLAAITVCAFIGVHAWYFTLQFFVSPQTKPYLHLKQDKDSGNEETAPDEQVMRELGVTDMESLKRRTPLAPTEAGVSVSHLFLGARTTN